MPTTEAERIGVAAGVLRNDAGEVLVGQRVVRDLYFEKWEFPGGKLEPGETAEQALARELREELGIEVSATEPLISLSHDYPDRRVLLHVLDVLDWEGEPRGLEGQQIRWVGAGELPGLDFLEANGPIMTAVGLPDQIHPGDDSAAPWYPGWVVVPGPEDAGFGRGNTAELFSEQPGEQESAVVISRHAGRQPQGGGGRMVNDDRLFAVTCCDAGELLRAHRMHADYLIVGPVHESRRFPGLAPLDWSGFESLAGQSRLPVYAAGGLSPEDRDRARALGGQGVVIS